MGKGRTCSGWALPILLVATALTETLGGAESSTETVNPIGFLPEWMVMPASPRHRGHPPRRRGVACDQAAPGIRDRAGPVHLVVFAFVLLSTTVLLTFLFIFISIGVGAGDPGDDAWGPAYLMMILFPLSFGVAVLRYRLYEIDRIVSRRVVCAGRRIVGRSVPRASSR